MTDYPDAGAGPDGDGQLEDLGEVIRSEFQAAYSAAMEEAVVHGLRGVVAPKSGAFGTWAHRVAFDARPIGVQVRRHSPKGEGRG